MFIFQPLEVKPDLCFVLRNWLNSHFGYLLGNKHMLHTMSVKGLSSTVLILIKYQWMKSRWQRNEDSMHNFKKQCCINIIRPWILWKTHNMSLERQIILLKDCHLTSLKIHDLRSMAQNSGKYYKGWFHIKCGQLDASTFWGEGGAWTWCCALFKHDKGESPRKYHLSGGGDLT